MGSQGAGSLSILVDWQREQKREPQGRRKSRKARGGKREDEKGEGKAGRRERTEQRSREGRERWRWGVDEEKWEEGRGREGRKRRGRERGGHWHGLSIAPTHPGSLGISLLLPELSEPHNPRGQLFHGAPGRKALLSSGPSPSPQSPLASSPADSCLLICLRCP